VAAKVTLPTLDDIPALFVVLIGIGMAGALVLFVFGVGTGLSKKERDDGPV